MVDHKWAPIGNVSNVLRHTRDLGTHLSLNLAMIGTTINQRIEGATNTVEKIARLPFTTKVKATLIRMAAFAKAFYGIEAAPCTTTRLSKLRTAVINAIGPNNLLRSPAMVFIAATDGDDLDPVAQVAFLRLTTMRRLLAWYPNLKKEADHLLEFYLEQKKRDKENKSTGTEHPRQRT